MPASSARSPSRPGARRRSPPRSTCRRRGGRSARSTASAATGPRGCSTTARASRSATSARELLADVDARAVDGRDARARGQGVRARRRRRAARRQPASTSRRSQRSGELVALEGGWWTTRELRELEQRALETARERAARARRRRVAADARDAGRRRDRASGIGTRSRDEQREALETITGPGGVVVLVGEAGTGKGVVLDAAREAWERDGHRVIGTAVAGATAQRLGADAGIRETMTADSLIAPRRARHARSSIDAVGRGDGRGRDGRHAPPRQR